MNIILASGSKRRSSILSSCGIKHEVTISDVRENIKGRYPSRLAMTNACLKARKVAEGKDSGFVIGADTVVLLGKKIIGKPINAGHAKKMLKAMSGKKIFVYTGLCVIDAKKKKSVLGYEKSEVKVKKIKPSDISRYFKLLHGISEFHAAGGAQGAAGSPLRGNSGVRLGGRSAHRRGTRANSVGRHPLGKLRGAERRANLLGPYDKAGGFSIEGVGSFLFDDIKGSYFNVLGLPIAKLKDMLERLGVDILKIIGK